MCKVVGLKAVATAAAATIIIIIIIIIIISLRALNVINCSGI